MPPTPCSLCRCFETAGAVQRAARDVHDHWPRTRLTVAVSSALPALTPPPRIIPQGFILVYSIADDVTFEGLNAIREEILRVHKNSQVPMLLVGNKKDMESERAVTKEEAQAQAKHFNCKFTEVSVRYARAPDARCCVRGCSRCTRGRPRPTRASRTCSAPSCARSWSRTRRRACRAVVRCWVRARRPSLQRQGGRRRGRFAPFCERPRPRGFRLACSSLVAGRRLIGVPVVGV